MQPRTRTARTECTRAYAHVRVVSMLRVYVCGHCKERKVAERLTSVSRMPPIIEPAIVLRCGMSCGRPDSRYADSRTNEANEDKQIGEGMAPRQRRVRGASKAHTALQL